MKKKYILFYFILTSFILTNCSSKLAYYEPYAPLPNKAIKKVDKKINKHKYKIYKKRLKKLKKEWKYYEKFRNALSKRKFYKLPKIYKTFLKYHKKYKKRINYNEYSYGFIFYSAKADILNYKFNDALKKLNLIPDNSIFYKKSLLLAKKLISDNDNDGFIDEWEIMEGFNPNNPYSHP